MKMRCGIICRCFLLLAVACLLPVADAVVRVEKKVHHLQDLKFDDEEYDDPEIDERDSGPEYPISPLDQPMRKRVNWSNAPSTSVISDKLDPNIKWDMRWPFSIDFIGQISAVSIHPNGNIGIFHRGERIWDSSTFGRDNKFNINRGPIRQSTIILLEKSGQMILEWGRNMFFLPHGLTIDSEGNYWVTDVAMHQVFKFDAQDIEKHKEQLMRQSFSQRASSAEKVDVNNLFENSVIKPSLVLGEAFQPGNDNLRFCKPTAVAVLDNGDFFVSDGYCNSRVIKFNKNGERILQWGRTWGMEGKAMYNNPAPQNALLIPHSLALAQEHDFIFIADRENARIVCIFASNGTFHKEYKHPAFNGAIYSIAYANNRVYLVNGARYPENTHTRGFVLDINTGELLSQFAPSSDMDSPHDIAVTADEREIYVVELNTHKIYKFNQDTRNLPSPKKTRSNITSEEARLAKSSMSSSMNGVSIEAKKPGKSRTLTIVAIVFALFFIVFCILLAALVARYQKRGCIFPPRKRRTEWNADKKNNFKLSSLFFEGRPNSREFSKLNTEPETSDDENTESSLEKMI
ncbi:peptidyl-alpha-hydroxyglycine alpha-amidating lyase 1 [Copidosoma floridanum]|uniref:peptidyl-alpha-hydroxyglycine alpha-amidating lyase 1 n=1 Tax=Copidosoma floridanum TaxID=29053 RepID=UPI0006C96C02|nr:peptidyl-alpha-hydroxyglycine alpha-amidating lyase 1 [Copidosoma floridanum]